MAIKHATASTFVFGLRPDGWRLGLIVHPIFGRLLQGLNADTRLLAAALFADIENIAASAR